MSGLRPTNGNLTNADLRQGLFLTLVFGLVLFSRLCHADNYTEAERARLSDAENYIRKQSVQGMSLLPGEVRSAVGWFSGGWHAMPLSGGDDEESAPPAPPPPASSALSSENHTPVIPINLAGTVHHKGFLPTHDAMMMGVGLSHNILQDKLQFTAHPFYGQNWRALQGYWGGEMALTIDKRSDDLPWGKIALGYVGGNEALTDHGCGMDLHGDVDLTHGWNFTSGLRQNSIDGNSNYVMMRWKMSFN